MKKYITSPLIFFQPDSEKIKLFDVDNQTRIINLHDSIYKVLWYFIVPNTVRSAVIANIDMKAVEKCIDMNLLLDVNSEKFVNAHRWELNNWSRAGYLMFSQENLPYIEKVDGVDDINLIDQRRDAMSSYMKESIYPKKYIPKGEVFELNPNVSSSNIDYNKIIKRKSIRAFSDKLISFNVFSDILIKATNNTRESETSKANKDPFFLLDSFYSWLVIYIVVQGVEGLERGVYFFDQDKKRLILVKKGVDDIDLANCIQKQNWIKGAGFSIFIGADWDRYSWIYRHSRAYINLLIQIGEISEEFVLHAYNKDIGGWMTPAVNESKSNKLCEIEGNNIDIMHFMKFGYKIGHK